MAATSWGLLCLLGLLSLLWFVGSNAEGPKKLTHPALTGTASLTLKVLYWYVMYI